MPFISEAWAISASQEGRWEDAIQHSGEWLDDQPFDIRAAVHASYISAIGLEKWAESASYAEIGLRSRPGHPLLTNNLAYALIEKGDLEEAKRVLTSIDITDHKDGDRVALLATKGLLAFRAGDEASGKSLYQSAIDLSRRIRDQRQEAMARAMLLRELLSHHFDASDVSPLVVSLHELLPRISDKGVLLCIRRAVEPISAEFGPVEGPDNRPR